MPGRNLNGHFLGATVALMERELSPEKREAVRKQLSKEVESALLTASGKNWYPAEQVLQVYDALRSVWTSEQEVRDGFIRLGKNIADNAANTFMRLFMKIVTPSMLFKQFPKVWPKYADFGRFELGLITADRFEFTVRDLTPMKYQPLISKGWTMYMLESMSKKNIDIATEPASGILGNGSYDMTIRARWT